MSERLDFGMPVHPICDLFPMMDADALARLASDIKANGLLNPIVVHDGQIVDGRNRVLACRAAGAGPRFTPWRELYRGKMTIDRWIWSLNVERRHMTPDQIAWAIVQRRAWQEKQAAHKRQVAGRSGDGTAGGRGLKKNLPQEAGEGLSNSRNRAMETNRILAKEAGVSRNKIDQAMAVQRLAREEKITPDVADQLKQGTVRLHEVLKTKTDPPVDAEPTTAAAAPAPNDSPISKRQQIVNGAAKTRMINVLSQIRGFCSNLASLHVEHVAAASTRSELDGWAAIAAEAAKELRLFSSRLVTVTKEKTA